MAFTDTRLRDFNRKCPDENLRQKTSRCVSTCTFISGLLGCRLLRCSANERLVGSGPRAQFCKHSASQNRSKSRGILTTQSERLHILSRLQKPWGEHSGKQTAVGCVRRTDARIQDASNVDSICKYQTETEPKTRLKFHSLRSCTQLYSVAVLSLVDYSRSPIGRIRTVQLLLLI